MKFQKVLNINLERQFDVIRWHLSAKPKFYWLRRIAVLLVFQHDIKCAFDFEIIVHSNLSIVVFVDKWSFVGYLTMISFVLKVLSYFKNQIALNFDKINTSILEHYVVSFLYAEVWKNEYWYVVLSWTLICAKTQ